MNKKITCIICPKGCTIYVNGEAGALSISGNACARGKRYAESECTVPMRTVTSAIRVENRPSTRVSVKTERPIPKGDIFALMRVIRAASASAPIRIGDALMTDIFGTRIIATENIN